MDNPRIGRIRIDSRLGMGGMGEVYRGHDDILQRDVAVKSIRADKRLDLEAKSRFLREAQILSRLNHPNICQIYDLVEADDADYLILEFIQGSPLRLLLNAGLADGEKLRIALGVVRALEAAHGENIVHRDLKPDNIMITPGGEVKVLDFGIARSVGIPAAGPDSGPGIPATEGRSAGSDIPAPSPGEAIPLAVTGSQAADLTTAGSLLGTLRYMSPEQARSEPASPASDMFAFGIILHELITGRSPYGEEKGLGLILRVSQAQLNLAEISNPLLERLIRDLLAPDPLHRPTAAQTRRRLEEVLSAPERRRRRRLLLSGGVAVALLLAAAIWGTYRMVRPRPLLPPGVHVRIAVLPFQNRTGSPAYSWVSGGLMAVVAAELGQCPGIDVVAPERVVGILPKLGLKQGEPLPPEQIPRLNRILGSNLILEVSAHLRERSFELLYHIHTANRTYSGKPVYSPDAYLAARILAGAALERIDPVAETSGAGRQLSSNPLVNHLYAIGTDRLMMAGPPSARKYFEVCLDLDPAYLPARLGLAQVKTGAGSWQEARNLFRQVLQDARARGDERLSVTILLQLGWNDVIHGQYPEAKVSLREALAKAAAMHRVDDQIDACDHLALAVFRTGESAEAGRLWARGLDLARREGGSWHQAAILNNMGLMAFNQREFPQAERLWSQALILLREIGYRVWEASVIGNLAMIARMRGDLAAATRLYREALSIHEESGGLSQQALTRFNIGETAHFAGRLAEAETEIRSALDLARRAGDQLVEGYAVVYLADIASRGRSEAKALDYFQQGETIYRKSQSAQVGNTLCEKRVLHHLRYGQLAPAARWLAKLDQFGREPEGELLHARYEYLRGNFAEALRLARIAAAGSDLLRQRMAPEMAVYERAAVGKKLPLPAF